MKLFNKKIQCTMCGDKYFSDELYAVKLTGDEETVETSLKICEDCGNILLAIQEKSDKRNDEGLVEI